MNSTTREQVFRGAIALNNIGIDLLKSRCYEQANVTLTDATSVMKSVFRSNSMDNSEETDTDEQVLSRTFAMLERAYKRRSRPMPMERHSSFRMLSLSDSSTTADIFLDSIYPIRIEDVNDIRSPGSLDHSDVQAAILLHNFGLSNLCLAQVSPKEHIRTVKLQQATYLFQLADDILEKTCAELEDDIELRQIACLNVAVLTALLRSLSLDESLHDKVKSVNDRLIYLGSAIQEIDEVLEWYSTPSHAAAAA